MKTIATFTVVLLSTCACFATEIPTDTLWSSPSLAPNEWNSDAEFSEDMRYILGGTIRGRIELRSIEDGKIDTVLWHTPGLVFPLHLEVLPILHQVVTVVDRSVKFWSYPSWTLLKEFTLPGNFPARALRVTPDGKTVVFVNEDRRVFAVDVASTDTLWHVFVGGFDATVAMSGDGRLIAASDGLRDVEMYEVLSGKSLGTIRALGDVVTAVDLSYDGSKLLVSSLGNSSFPENGPGALSVWDVALKRVIWDLVTPIGNYGFTATIFTPRASGVYTGASDGKFSGVRQYKIWDSIPVKQYQPVPRKTGILRASEDSALGLGFSGARIWLNRVSWTQTTDVQPPNNFTISVYPNPSSTGWTVTGLGQYENIVWTLANLSGRVIRQGESVVAQGRVVIDASVLPSGVYLLQLAHGTQQIHSSTVQVQ